MQGEEGVTSYFDIELVKNKKTKAREAYLNTGKIKKDDTYSIIAELDSVATALKKVKLT